MVAVLVSVRVVLSIVVPDSESVLCCSVTTELVEEVDVLEAEVVESLAVAVVSAAEVVVVSWVKVVLPEASVDSFDVSVVFRRSVEVVSDDKDVLAEASSFDARVVDSFEVAEVFVVWDLSIDSVKE